MKTSLTKEENSFISIARILACFGVIVIHTVSSSLLYLGKIPTYEWWMANVLDSFFIWSVPLFVMVSGALLLNPERRDSSWVFYKKRLIRVGIPTLFWVSVYIVLSSIFQNASLNPVAIAKKLLFQQPYDNLYFLFIIAELYLITPILLEVRAKSSKNMFFWITMLFLFIGIFWKPQRFLFTMFVPYIGYYMLGSHLLNISVSKKMVLVWFLLFLFSGIALIILTNLTVTRSINIDSDRFYFYRHLSPFVILLTTSVFILLQSKTAIIRKFVSPTHLKRVATAALGIYLVHWWLRIGTLKVLFGSSETIFALPWLGMIAMILYLFIGSFLITKLIQKIPYLKLVV